MKTKDIKRELRKKETFSEMFNNKFSVLQYFPFLSHEHNVIESIAIENKRKETRKKSYYKLFFHLLMNCEGFSFLFVHFLLL
jgi:hypothetical protein